MSNSTGNENNHQKAPGNDPFEGDASHKHDPKQTRENLAEKELNNSEESNKSH